MHDEEAIEEPSARRVPWLALVMAVQSAAIGGLAWMAWDTRETVDAIWRNLPGEPMFEDTPAWAGRVERSADDAASEARRAADAAEQAKRAADAACRAASEYSFAC
jgi:hypothetical protein